VAETLRYLDLVGVGHAGAGRNGSEARRAALARSGAFVVAFLAYAEPVWSVVEARDPPWPAPLATIGPGGAATAAGRGEPGTAVVRDDSLRADIAALRARGDVDLVAVSFHWGEEFETEPNAYQRKYARMAVDAGADLVLGHHPHVLQGLERYKDGIILYSLGNAVFDMDPDATYDALAAILRLGRDSAGRARVQALELLPLRIARGSWAPSPARGEDRRRITDYLKARSAKLGLELRAGGSGMKPLVEGEDWRPSLAWTRDTGR
jgi:poly-gamma-glutamate synthesis protein (capsule biosynthesis protein)